MVCIVVAVVSAQAALAQSPLRMNGSAGMTAKGYSVSGIDNRRAPTAIEAFARLSFDLAGLTSGINLSYSSDQSGVRQSINKFAFRTSWDSGALSVGDVSTNYSAYSMRGVTTRGGSIEQSIGPFFIAAAGGRSRRAVDISRLQDFRGASFSRYLFGSRFGVGRPNGTHAHIIAVYAKDNEGSITDPGELRPAASTSVTPSVAFSMLDGSLRLSAQVTGSLYTADHTDTIETETALPGFARVFATAGSRLDYATSMDLAFQQPNYGLVTSFTRVQPGFQSLGLSQIRSDEQTVRIAPRVRLMNGRLALSSSLSRSENNLYENLLSTLVRDQLDAAIQFQATQRVSLTVAGNVLRNVAEPVGSEPAFPEVELQQKQIGRTIMIAPAWLHQSSGGTSHTATLSASRQTFEDRSDAVLQGLRLGFESTNSSLLGVYSLRLPSSLSFTMTGNLVASEASSSDATIRSATLGIGYRPLTSLNTTVTGGWSTNELTFISQDESLTREGTQLTAGLAASYSVTRSSALRFQLRAIANRSDQDFGDFDEVQSSLTFTQRF